MLKQMNKVISVFDKKTSMRLTNTEWRMIDEICYNEKLKRKILFEKILKHHNPCLGLTPAIRLFSLSYYYLKSKPHLNCKNHDVVEQSLNELL